MVYFCTTPYLPRVFLTGVVPLVPWLLGSQDGTRVAIGKFNFPILLYTELFHYSHCHPFTASMDHSFYDMAYLLKLDSVFIFNLVKLPL